MVKPIGVLVLLCLSGGQLPAQKPPVGLDMLGHDKWPSVMDGTISPDGAFVSYRIRNQPPGSYRRVIRSIAGPWQLELPNVGDVQFSDDSRHVLFMRGADSLGIVALRRGTVEYRSPVQAFQLFRRDGKEYLVYQTPGDRPAVVIEQLATGQQQRFANVGAYLISANGRRLVLREPLGGGRATLAWVELPSAKRTVVWRGAGLGKMVVDSLGAHLAFVVDDSGSAAGTSLWHYTVGMLHPTPLVGSRSEKIGTGLELADVAHFSVSAERLFVTLKERAYPPPSPEAVKVDVWHYRDAKVQSQQLTQDVRGNDYAFARYIGPRTYRAMIDVGTRRVLRLEGTDERLWILRTGGNDDWGFVRREDTDATEGHWNELARPAYYLVSLKDGRRTAVSARSYTPTPGGRYLIGDDWQGNLVSYEIATGRVRNITQSVPVPAGDAGYDRPDNQNHRGLRSAGQWLSDDALLLYDRYDIWQVDIRGEKPPVNVTNGYGRKHRITFRFIDVSATVARPGTRVILDAFDHNTKDNGFYQLVLGRPADPVPLTMGRYVYWASPHQSLEGERPVKARDGDRYLVLRSSATEAPNYFWTTDFKRFTPLTDVRPERAYRWLTSELVTFPALDGRPTQGVLYKPENFDPTRKYPVIVHYYEQKSELLNRYLVPGWSDGNINIPYFVGRGYLVFTPDIQFTIGHPGRSMRNSIVAAGQYLARLPFVDPKRLGLSGRSFGGSATAEVITHSGLFAAACVDAGVTNLISQYGHYQLSSGAALQGFTERQQNRMGATLWERPDLYIENSPIFAADKVTTPVLIVSNKLDGIVHFPQGVQFFLALRRLGKRAWLLQYDGEAHSLLQPKNQRDLTIRLTQFFDHYLKGAPAPVWMTRGVPARDKGVRTGLEYDPEIPTPGPGLLRGATTADNAAGSAATH